VLLLDDDADVRMTVCELITLITGRSCIALASVADLQARRDEALACTHAILDINLGPQQPSGVDAYAWLKEQRFAGAITFLTGHAQAHPLVARAAALGEATVYRKPIGVDELLQIIGAPPETRA